MPVENFSQWDFAEQFSGFDVAALMLGLEPSLIESIVPGIQIIIKRMKADYENTRSWYYLNLEVPPADQKNSEILRPCSLTSVKMDELHRINPKLVEHLSPEDFDTLTPFENWLGNKERSKFEIQEFSREVVVNWLKATGGKSIYKFNRLDIEVGIIFEKDIDPLDFPTELDAANMAYRTVRNGFDVSTGTFKNKVIAYLKKYHPEYSASAIERISTVTNPDKSPGRK